MKTQFGEMTAADFSKNTMEFEIKGEMIFQAGEYAIVPIYEYNNLIKTNN